MQMIGKYVFFTGILLSLVGLILLAFGNKLNWLGNLPGDLKFGREGFRFYFPIATCIVLSLILSIIIWIVRKIQ